MAVASKIVIWIYGLNQESRLCAVYYTVVNSLSFDKYSDQVLRME